jgi:uncharacterized protein YecE (DUF72 family)
MYIYIGTSGYKFPNWKGKYYPIHLPANNEFSYYMNDFNTVEINNTYYKMPSKTNWQDWKNTAQKRFLYSIKANKLIVHSKDPKKLKKYWSSFYAGLKILQDNLGCVLFQYPTNFEYNEKNFAVLETLADLLPKNIRFAFEFRHDSWFNNEIQNLFLKKKWVVVIDHVKNTGWIDGFNHGFNPDLSKYKLTADFVYIRLHGSEGQYVGGYRQGVLDEIIEFLQKRKPKYAFIYFNNTDRIDKRTKLPEAVKDAKNLYNSIPRKMTAGVSRNLPYQFFEMTDNEFQ